MSLKKWEKKVLAKPGAAKRVAEIEDELRLAAGLTALREDAGLSQRELASRMKVSQPRVAAIERSENVTVGVLKQYVSGVGGELEVTARVGRSKIPLLPASQKPARAQAKRSKTAGSSHRSSASKRARSST
jgi:transcriptional regulator with XRE-family HTH domain